MQGWRCVTLLGLASPWGCHGPCEAQLAQYSKTSYSMAVVTTQCPQSLWNSSTKRAGYLGTGSSVFLLVVILVRSREVEAGSRPALPAPRPPSRGAALCIWAARGSSPNVKSWSLPRERHHRSARLALGLPFFTPWGLRCC